MYTSTERTMLSFNDNLFFVNKKIENGLCTLNHEKYFE